MELYKGYVKTNGKRSLEKFKGRTDFKTYEEVKDYDSFGGVLAENTILIDIDDEDTSSLIMDMIEDLQINCKVIMTTRGRHFLFRNDGVTKCYTHTRLACGVVADIKVGSANSYEILKIDGEERFVEWDVDDRNYDTIPKWLMPIKGGKDFNRLEEGDGRNQSLFNFILTLQANRFNIEDIKETISLINKYILAVPLPDCEIETILREEAFEKPILYEADGKFLFDEFAKYVVAKYHIIRINNQLHLYENGAYTNDLKGIEATMINVIPNISMAKRREVMSYIDLLVRSNTEQSKPNLIAFANGVLDIETNDLMPFSPNYVITNKINWDYNPNAYNELLDHTINKIACNDEQVRANLEEMVGYCLFRRNELGKCFILTGEGSNGKSTWLNLIKYMLGGSNYSVLDLKKLGDRFSTIMLFGKLANIGDDISSEFISDVAEFKKIVTGEEIDAEQKGMPKFNFTPYVKCIFSSNNIPRMGKGKDFGAIKRRLVIIPFNAHFSKRDTDYVPYIIDSLKEKSSVEYMIRLGIEGLKRVIANNSFTHSDKAHAQLEEYEEVANPLVGFIKEYKEDIANQSTSDVYHWYTEYCLENNLTAMGRKVFVSQLCKTMNLKSEQRRINRRRVQVLVGG